MSSLELLTKSSEASTKASKEGAPVETKKGAHASRQQGTMYNYIFNLLLDCMNTRQQGVLTMSKELTQNASAQEQANDWERGMHFKSIPNGAKSATIDQIQNYNKEVSDQRANVQNQLITLRQQSSIEMTEANTGINSLEQDASMDSGWLKTLQQIFQVITQMTQG